MAEPPLQEPAVLSISVHHCTWSHWPGSGPASPSLPSVLLDWSLCLELQNRPAWLFPFPPNGQKQLQIKKKNTWIKIKRMFQSPKLLGSVRSYHQFPVFTNQAHFMGAGLSNRPISGPVSHIRNVPRLQPYRDLTVSLTPQSVSTVMPAHPDTSRALPCPRNPGNSPLFSL